MSIGVSGRQDLADHSAAGGVWGSPRLARFVAAHRRELARLIYDQLNAAGSPRYLARDAASLEDRLEHSVGSLVDLFGRYLETADPSYLILFLSDLRWSFRDIPVAREEQIAGLQRAVETIRQAVVALGCSNRLEAKDQRALEETMASLAQRTALEAKRRLRVLLIGDCVTHDIMAFLEEGCLWDGISLEPILLGSTNPAELRNQIRGQLQTGRTFDLVFYIPFTYDSVLELRTLNEVGGGFASERKIQTLATEAVAALKPNLKLLSNLMACPVFVHNASMIQRFEPTLKSRLKARSSQSVRARAASVLAPLVAGLLAEVNSAGPGNLRLIDETAFVAEHGDTHLGTFFHTSEAHHPAVFGRVAAECYRDHVFVHARLATKKLVVCDLDNTIWEGVIGEGRVVPFLDRQAKLKKLRERGVLLAVNSKNDPANVRYDGCAIGKDDFVWEEINWNLKVSNMRRIQEGLNLKMKDFLFLDDRADEREMVQQTFPEILALDATADRTWRLLDLWGDALPPEPEMNRTRMYKEREQREAFVSSQQTVVEDQSALLRQLQIKVEIRRAKRSELARVAELINRTNQFNLNGARTTLQEVQAWHASPSHRILVASVADKFGDSGTVCVCVVEDKPAEIRILAFVLSCRVFGYAVEHAIVNHLKSRVRDGERRERRIIGEFSVTQHNQPCHQFYPDNGFELRDGRYVWDGRDAPADAAWLTIAAETAA